jgi:hypothetical protein
MKRMKLEKANPIFWILFAGLATALSVAGCGRKAQFNGQSAAVGSSQDRKGGGADTAPLDLSAVTVTATNLSITDAAFVAYNLVRNQLVLRTEQYTNPNSGPVWIWVRPQASGLHFWGLCSTDRAQYQVDPSAQGIEFQGGTLISKGLPFDEWGVFELAAGSSATLEWLGGGRWSWNPGPYQAPGDSCNETSPQRGWAGFSINGVLEEDARVTPPNVPVADATGDRNFLDSTRILALPPVEQSLNQHWGDWP